MWVKIPVFLKKVDFFVLYMQSLCTQYSWTQRIECPKYGQYLIANLSASGALRSCECAAGWVGLWQELPAPRRVTVGGSSLDSLPVFQEEPESRFFSLWKSPVY